jgi:DNA-binding GntR family transcriptional regulator
MNLAGRKTDVVYDQLKARFLAGELRFGERLEVNELAESMGTSRQPVLEALKRLQHDGLVEVIPQVGSRVVVPRPSAVADFFRVFAALEALATRMAAERWTASDLERLETTTDLVLNAVEGGQFDLTTYLDANRQFHDTIHSIARSPEAAQAARRYWDRSDFLIASVRLPQMHDTLSRSVSEHRAIYAAIEAHDAEGAARLATEHVEGFAVPVEQSVLEALELLDSANGRVPGRRPLG